MSINFKELEKIGEGKTKVVYANPQDRRSVYLVFKDDITAGDGVKHDIVVGKAVVDWCTNRNIFEFLNRMGVRTHYISSPEERVALVKKLERKIDLEVVTRRVATGSIIKWTEVEEGTRFEPPITQFHYKDDPLHDPMLDNGYIDYLIRKKGAYEYHSMREVNSHVFLLLERAFANFSLQLIDLKLEYGIVEKEVSVIDEITGGSLRLWPYAHKNPDLQQANVLKELDPQGRLDKDIYRMGGAVSEVLTKFEEIARVTARFKDLQH